MFPLRSVVSAQPKWRYFDGQTCDWFVETECGHLLIRERLTKPPKRVRCEACDPTPGAPP